MEKAILIDSFLPPVFSTNIHHLLSGKKCLDSSIFRNPCSGKLLHKPLSNHFPSYIYCSRLNFNRLQLISS